jgi:hypothetical protein
LTWDCVADIIDGMKNTAHLCSVATAASIIGCTECRVRQLLQAGRLAGQKIHTRAWIVDVRDAKRVRDLKHRVGAPRISRRGKKLAKRR